MSLKYQIIFKTREDHTCKVNFVIDGYEGPVIQLQGTESPFILREFNTSEDLFKPLRPQQAEISFISQTNVSIDDFLGNSDEYCFIGFEFLSTTQYYWSGYLLQDDFQETWQDTKHIITLRATEGLGMLKNNQIADFSGNELIGKYTPYQLIEYASNGSVLPFIRTHVINNLYHSTMDDTITVPSINQCYIDVKTFSTGDGFYEDSYTVLEKINSAFSQTMFQYKSRWYFLRLEELYITNTDNLRVININALGSNTRTNQRFDVNVGVNEEVKPINPEMLRFINRPTKVDTINVSYDYFPEILCNQNWKRGTLITSTSTYKTYTVNNWNAYKGLRESPTPVTVAHYRKDTIDAYGDVTDSYLYLQYEDTPPSANAADWWQSCDITINQGDCVNISFDWRWSEGGFISTPIPTFNVAQVLFKSDPAFSPVYSAGLNNAGEWVIYPGDWDSLSNPNIPYLTILPTASSTTQNGYLNINVQSIPIFRNGIIRVLLHNTIAKTYNNNWKNLQFVINKNPNLLISDSISGDFDKFTKTENYKGNFEDEIYLDDLPNYNFKGTIYDEGSYLLTTPTWYRYRYNTEEFRFKKQNLIAHFENTRFYRNKIDATFYGLTWNNGSNPIGLINTIKFVNDDPNKIYYILNLKEINFSNSTWSATLIEVYDNDRDNGVETTYPTFTHDFIYT